jgi:alkylation response protein AidB-like acyl-CoA dehydrogenase
MSLTSRRTSRDLLRALPGDAARQIMWRFSDRDDVQRLVRSVRSVARGEVARLVAGGARRTAAWTPEKDALLAAYDRAGVTTVSVDRADGGQVEGPKSLALALSGFELAWVDAGAASIGLAQHLALAPIRDRGTAAQRRAYLRRAAGADGKPPIRGAFCLTEPLPNVGVETGLLGGSLRISEWRDGEEPVLQVDKRGRFITNMAFADFVIVAVGSADSRIKGSCMVILERDDPGTFDRGRATPTLVHQLSSTHDPVFSLKVPASRIVGGYDVVEGCIVPRSSHGDVAETVFRRTRVTVGAMTAAKLLSAVEPVLRYQRGRFRGASSVTPGTPRYEMGLQLREDAQHRLIDVWAAGEAAASLAFAAARAFDDLEPVERRMTEEMDRQGVRGGAARVRALRRREKDAAWFLREAARPAARRNTRRLTELAGDAVVQYVVANAVAAVLGPAAKLWNTGHGATMMREAVSLMGGYGIIEDCPGFLGQKWMDAQLEATYEGPESVQRRTLSNTMVDEVFLAQFRAWTAEIRQVASSRPGTGACVLATAMDLWAWTVNHHRRATDPEGRPLYDWSRQGVTFPMADALGWLLASCCQILDVLELEAKGPACEALATELTGLVSALTDLCHVQAARAAGEVARITSSLVFGYRRHPAWDAEGCAACFAADDLAEFEVMIPGIESSAGAYADVIGAGGSHEEKAGPCAGIAGLEDFEDLRRRMDACLTGARLAKDRVADALTAVAIPEALDYPRAADATSNRGR